MYDWGTERCYYPNEYCELYNGVWEPSGNDDGKGMCNYGSNVVLAKLKNSEMLQAIPKRQTRQIKKRAQEADTSDNDSEEDVDENEDEGEDECELFAETWTACGQMVGDEYVWDPWTGCCWTEQEFCSLSGGEWDETSGSCIWWYFNDIDSWDDLNSLVDDTNTPE